MSMSMGRASGAAVGVCLGLILCVCIFKAVNTNRKIKTEYDERQLLVRGKGYTIAFYTVIVYEALMMILTMSGIEFPVQDYILHVAGIFVGCTVLGAFCIWNDVYWGLNNDRKKYIWVIMGALALNLMLAAGAILNGGLMEDGKLGMPMLNIMVVIMLFIIMCEMLIKHVMDNNGKNEEE